MDFTRAPPLEGPNDPPKWIEIAHAGNVRPRAAVAGAKLTAICEAASAALAFRGGSLVVDAATARIIGLHFTPPQSL